MKKIIIKLVIVIALFCLPNTVLAQNSSDEYLKTSGELKQILLDNFAGYQKEDITLILPTVHTLSPGYAVVKDIADKIFPVYDLKYELVSFRYLLTDGEYALARVQQKTTKVKGPAFKNNLIDLIVVYKQENGQWKLWSQVILGVEYL